MEYNQSQTESSSSPASFLATDSCPSSSQTSLANCLFLLDLNTGEGLHHLLAHNVLHPLTHHLHLPVTTVRGDRAVSLIMRIKFLRLWGGPGRKEGVLGHGGDEGEVGPELGCSGLVLAGPEYCLGLSLEISFPLSCSLVQPRVGLCRVRPDHPQGVGCHQGQ